MYHLCLLYHQVLAVINFELCLLSNRVDVCLSVCLSIDQKILKQLKYMVIRSEKGTITTFELFFEGDSAIYDIWELQNPVISYFLL